MPDLSLDLHPETPADHAAIERLHERAFGPGRFSRTDFRLREGVAPFAALCFTARVGTLLVGSIRLSPIEIGPGTPAVLLGPPALEDVVGEGGEGGKSNSNSWCVGRHVGSVGISELNCSRDLRNIVM